MSEKKKNPGKKNGWGKTEVKKKGGGTTNALKKKGEGKNGCGKKNQGPGEKGEKKKAGRKKNEWPKKAGEKTALGKKNALLKTGRENGRPAITRGPGARNRRSVLKLVAPGRSDEARTGCAECGTPAIPVGRGTEEIRPGRGTGEIAGGRGTAETLRALGGRGADDMRLVPAAKGRGGSARVFTRPGLGVLRGDWGGVGRTLKVPADGVDCKCHQPANAGGLIAGLDV